MRVCFTSDLHGDRTLYGQLADLVRAERPELLILGGDLLRDVNRDEPIVPQAAARVADLMEQVNEWRQALPDLTVACIVGNHEILPELHCLRRERDAGRIVLLEAGGSWNWGGYHWAGYGCSPPSPHWAKDFERLDHVDTPVPEFDGVEWDPDGEKFRQVFAEQYFRGKAPIIERLRAVPALLAPWILVAHAPPHETALDRLPNVPHPIGSKAVREFILERQPILSLHGHVHESPIVSGSFRDKLGSTVCVNPGQGHEQLHAVLFDLARPTDTLRHTVLS